MGIETFAVSQCRNDRSKYFETVLGDLLRCDVFLERECIDPAELASISVRRKSVVGSRGVVTATEKWE